MERANVYMTQAEMLALCDAADRAREKQEIDDLIYALRTPPIGSRQEIFETCVKAADLIEKLLGN